VRSFLTALFVLGSLNLGFTSSLPLTARDISLMLRTGYSSEAVLRELSTRHFSDAFDTETEKQLKQAGANAELLGALRTGAYRISPSEVVTLDQKQQHQRTSVRASDAKDGSDVKQEAASPQPASTPPADQVYRVLKGDLIVRQKGVFIPLDDEKLQSKKLFLFFFSANWSPLGRKFTPRLVEHYERIVAQHPEIEVIFFSADRSQFSMETYMSQSNMPWPAVAFPQIATQATAIEAGLVQDIPCLILLDSSGKMLSKSANDQNGAGLEKVLSDLDNIFAQGAASTVQQRN
jgi:nucleoredoxin